MNPNSRQLLEQLRPGEHHLHNTDLRSAYGLSRVTAKARNEIARELRQAGLEILSDPADEPLVVRKTAPGQARANGVVRRWWKRPLAIAAAGLIALIMLVAVLSDDDKTSKAANQPPAVASVAETTTTEPPTEPQPDLTLIDAAEKVDQDHYAAALAIAKELSDEDEHRIMQKISRRLANRAINALRSGDRTRARFLLNRADDYSSTPQSVDAWARYYAAQPSVAPTSSTADDPSPSVAPPSAPAPDTSGGPSTTNWCGKRDGDGDGIYCE
jgi:type IV secretory pathway VirB10-like protein